MWAIRPVTAEWLDGNKVRLTNRRVFTSTEDLAVRWSLLENGCVIDGGFLDAVLAAGGTADVELPLTMVTANDADYHLNIDCVLKRDAGWADAGHLVSWDQLELSMRAPASLFAEIGSVASGNDVGGQSITAGRLTVKLDDEGLIERVQMDGATIIDGDITACFWRAPTDNDGVQTLAESVMPSRMKEWQALGLDRLERSTPRVRLEGDILLIEREWSAGTGPKAVHRSRWHRLMRTLASPLNGPIFRAWASVSKCRLALSDLRGMALVPMKAMLTATVRNALATGRHALTRNIMRLLFRRSMARIIRPSPSR
jgi:hypothetical protein